MKHIMTIDSHQSDINDIIKQEITACDSYKMIMSDEKRNLKRFQSLQKAYHEHRWALAYWKRELKKRNILAISSAGIAGLINDTYLELSRLFRPKYALIVVKTSEEKRFNQYQDVLTNNNLTKSQKMSVKNIFIPRQQEYITTLNGLIDDHKVKEY